MEGMNIVLWIVGSAFAVIFGLLLCIWHFMSQKFENIDRKFEIIDRKFEYIDGKFETKINSLEERLNTKINSLEERLEAKIDKLEHNLTQKIEKVDEKVTDVDRRLCRLEGAFSAKECCVIKDERHLKKAE